MKVYKFDAYSSQREAISVTQLNEYIKLLLDSSASLSDVYLRGEISNFTHHRTGHFYFTIKDSSSAIKAVMFRSDAQFVSFEPKNGMKVLVSGRVSAFVRDGQYQIYVNTMEPDGIGSLYLAFEQLKQKLSAEGLFAEERKKAIPPCPQKVGIITSPTGAAIRDIINISKRRYPLAELLIFPSLVQGQNAPAQLIMGVEYFNATESVDVIIIGRGGGSLEDLWAFNDEDLARAIFASEIPIISAVGHEIDFTICDFVADKRAPTPSAAAELAVPDSNELRYRIDSQHTRAMGMLNHKISAYRNRLQGIAWSKSLRSPYHLIEEKRMTLISVSEKMDYAVRDGVKSRRKQFEYLTGKLNALSPLAIIYRGYSVVFSKDNTLIKATSDVNIGDTLQIRVSNGDIGASVTSITVKRAEEQ